MRPTLLAAAVISALVLSNLLSASSLRAEEAKPALLALHCGHLIDADAGKLLGASTIAFQHIGILSLEFHVDKLSRPLL